MSNAKPEPEDVGAEQAGSARRRDRVADVRLGLRVLAADVEVAAVAPVANAAIVIASTTANGSPSSRTRSLNVPGSDSSALQTR